MRKKFFKVKKIFIASLLFLCLGIAYKSSQNYGVYAAMSDNTAEELGYAINVIKSNNHLRYNMGAPVLKEDYLKNLIAKKATNISQKENTYKAISFSEITEKFSSETKNTVGIGYNGNIFSGSMKTTYEKLVNKNYNQCESQFYAMHTYEKVLCELALPSYSTFSYTYQNQYSDTFLYRLDLLNEEPTKEKFYKFFDEFGTHVIVSALYGGRLDMYYAIISNSMEFTTEVKNQFSIAIDASIANLAKFNTSTKLSFTNIQSDISGNCEYNNATYVLGGNMEYSNSLIQNFGGTYNNWKNSINENNASLIGYSDGGLLPIWETLPSQYVNLKGIMEKYFHLYAEYENESINNNFGYGGKNYILEEPTKIMLRTAEKKITDSGRFKNHYDVIDLKSMLGVYLSTLKYEGVKKIKIDLTLDVREIDDGYQHLFLYTKKDDVKSNKLLWHKEFEHTKGKKNTNYKTYTFSCEFFLDQLENEKIYLRYGASGALDDDWKNKNVIVNITLTKNLS